MAIRSRETLIGAWAFLIGVIIALIFGIVAVFVGSKISPVILLILVGLGVVVGYFVAEKDVMTFLLASISLVIVSSLGMQGLVLNAAIQGVNISQMISAILGALLFLFIPATIIVALKTVFSIANS